MQTIFVNEFYYIYNLNISRNRQNKTIYLESLRIMTIKVVVCLAFLDNANHEWWWALLLPLIRTQYSQITYYIRINNILYFIDKNKFHRIYKCVHVWIWIKSSTLNIQLGSITTQVNSIMRADICKSLEKLID